LENTSMARSPLFVMPSVPIPERPGVYLCCFEPRLGHAGHYLGSAAVLPNRLNVHAAGNGARLVMRALEAGCKVSVVRIWVTETEKEAKTFEASFKHHGGKSPNSRNGRHGARTSLATFCPIHCPPGRDAAHQKPLPLQWLAGQPAPEGWIPWADTEEPPF
jgi:hypothetical protein